MLYLFIIMMKTLFVSFFRQSDNSVPEYSPKPIGKTRSGLGFVCYKYPIQYFLSTLGLTVEKHVRSSLGNPGTLTVPAIRTGQGFHVNVALDPDGWKILRATFCYIDFKFVCCLS